MATTINFPDGPSLNDTYIYGDVTYKFDGTHWYVLGASTLTLSTGKILVGDGSNKAAEQDLLVEYVNVDSKLKSKASISATVNLSANGIGEITLAANTAFTFTSFELNKNYLLKITANGFTPSFAVGARHEAVEGNAEFATTGTFYVSLTCIDSTSGSEILLTTILKQS